MEKRNTSYKDLIQGLKSREEKAVGKLYKRIFDMCFQYLNIQGVENNQVVLFQDAFIVFEKKVLAGRLFFPDNEEEASLELRIKKYFERIIDQLNYHVERSIFQVVEGVKQKNKLATQRLVAYLQNHNFLQYTRKQVTRFNVTTVEAYDFLSEASTIILDKISDGSFSLEADFDNDHNQRRLSKFFCQIIFRQISKWKRDQQRKNDRNIEYANTQNEEKAVDPIVSESHLLFEVKIADLLGNLDKAGRYILKASYFEQLTPKQIAKKIPYEAYQNTQKVSDKKIISLKKLNADLFAFRKKLMKEDLKKLEEITRAVLTAIKEPCRSILRYAFPPENKNLEEIALILQSTRPSQEVQNLKTSAQIRKRKYKCKLTLWDDMWKNILTPKY